MELKPVKLHGGLIKAFPEKGIYLYSRESFSHYFDSELEALKKGLAWYHFEVSQYKRECEGLRNAIKEVARFEEAIARVKQDRA